MITKKEEKKLYHISYDYKKTIKKFVPSIPPQRCGGEDGTIKRICTSNTLEGCMIGHPNLWYHMMVYPEAEYCCPYEMMDRLTTLLDHNEEVGYLLKVYEFKAIEEDIIPPATLLKEKLVPDADETQEHWITKEISASHVFYVFITDAMLKDNKKTFEYTIYQEEELGRLADGDYHYNKQRYN